jgi:hypothetical protein
MQCTSHVYYWYYKMIGKLPSFIEVIFMNMENTANIQASGSPTFAFMHTCST